MYKQNTEPKYEPEFDHPLSVKISLKQTNNEKEVLVSGIRGSSHNLLFYFFKKVLRFTVPYYYFPGFIRVENIVTIWILRPGASRSHSELRFRDTLTRTLRQLRRNI